MRRHVGVSSGRSASLVPSCATALVARTSSAAVTRLRTYSLLHLQFALRHRRCTRGLIVAHAISANPEYRARVGNARDLAAVGANSTAAGGWKSHTTPAGVYIRRESRRTRGLGTHAIVQSHLFLQKERGGLPRNSLNSPPCDCDPLISTRAASARGQRLSKRGMLSSTSPFCYPPSG